MENDNGLHSDFTAVLPVRGASEVKFLFAEANLRDCVICGGYVRWMCSPCSGRRLIPPTDVDIYAKTIEAHDSMLEYLTKSSGMIETKSNQISRTFTDKEHKSAFWHLPPIQLIKPVKEGHIVAVGSLNEILSNFDFSVVRIGLLLSLDGAGGFVAIADQEYMEDEKNHRLRLKNIHCPISSLMRCNKYSKKGYWLPPSEAMKLFEDWDARTPEYRDKLRDFLKTASKGTGLSQEQVDEMEALMRID